MHAITSDGHPLRTTLRVTWARIGGGSWLWKPCRYYPTVPQGTQQGSHEAACLDVAAVCSAVEPREPPDAVPIILLGHAGAGPPVSTCISVCRLRDVYTAHKFRESWKTINLSVADIVVIM